MTREIGGDDSLSLQKLQSGDRDEFARLVERYSDQIYRLAMKMLANSQDAEDVLQETFLKAFRSIHNFKGFSSINTWLYRIAVNEALMLIRKRKPDQMQVDLDVDEDDDQIPMQIVDWEPMPEDQLMSTENIAHLNRLVQSLSPALRVVFLLRDVQEMSVKETAEVLGITEISVKTRLSRARFKLRQGLSLHFGKDQTLKGR
ncbi:MAG: sigma-70 family RNA polymerase sigma factor [Chloroflexi bacterium]|nr:sigma-70 family RNA polymerase sigma factor [Chloroflexota bacterium]